MSKLDPVKQAAAEQGVSELEYLKFKASKKADDSLEATRRMREMCEESDQAGIKTLTELDEQGSKLNRVEEDLDHMNSDLRRAEKNLRKMKKWFTPFSMCMGPRRGNKTKDKNSEGDGGDHESDENPSNGQTSKKASKFNPTIRNGNARSHGGIPATHVARITGDDREDEMEENLEAVSNILGNLKEMAITIGNEVTSQNQQLDRINTKTHTNMARIGAATDAASKI